MKPPDFLVAGHERFRRGRMAGEVRKLAGGQSPKVMVIACSDSRVHPATIFDAHPGEIFMVRNVANIVPPYEENSGYHGTSAALEFAVNNLKIKHILVLGHSECGGVQAALAASSDCPAGAFIGPWVGLMGRARDRVLAANRGAAQNELQTLLERANVENSLANLMTFPFVRGGVEEGTLQLLGARFDIKTAGLEWIS